MPLPAAELRRGRIVIALFPFAAAFPLRLVDGREVSSIEAYLRMRGGEPTALEVDARARPVLLLHDRTRGQHGDVVCLRINTVKPAMRRSSSWERIERHEHPFFFHLPASVTRYGLKEDSMIALSSIGAVQKSAIAGPRPVGQLTGHEMQIVSERLARLLSLDLAPLVAAKAQELLRRVARSDTS
jgi:mRNA-degrading endonuclease toxin of MazEF toxin-antitoxin module